MKILNRRRFLQSSGSLCLLGGAPAAAAGSSLAYVGFDQGIHVYEVTGMAWRHIQTVASRKPASLLLDSRQKLLFAANDIDEHEGLPHGTVEAFRVDDITGRLQLVNRARLSLSAVRPRHLALASATNELIAASQGGGAYNVFSFDAKGILSEPAHIYKEIGCGPQVLYQSAAHPHSLLSDGAGNWIASDLGADRLSVFRIRGRKLVRVGQMQVRPGDGPGPLAFDAARVHLSVLNVLHGSVSSYSYSPQSGQLGCETKRIPTGKTDGLINHGSLLLHGGNLLAAINTKHESVLTVWSGAEGKRSLRGASKAFYSLLAHPDNRSWLALDRAAGRILVFDEHLQSSPVAQVGKPLCLVFKPV